MRNFCFYVADTTICVLEKPRSRQSWGRYWCFLWKPLGNFKKTRNYNDITGIQHSCIEP